MSEENPYMLIQEQYTRDRGNFIIKIVNNTPYWLSNGKIITFFDMIKVLVSSYYTNPEGCFMTLNNIKSELDNFNTLDCYNSWIMIIQIVTQYLKDLSTYSKSEPKELETEDIFDIISKKLKEVSGSNFQEIQVFLNDELNSEYTILFFRLYSTIYPVFIVTNTTLKDEMIQRFDSYLNRNEFNKGIIISEKLKKTIVPSHYLHYPLSEFVKISKETVIQIRENK